MSILPFDHIRIVLVHTSHPGNIGAAARAMKTMCLNRLILVQPKSFPSAECTARATGADDILQNASVVDSVAEAIADCSVVYGTTARARSIEWPVLTPAETASEIQQAGASGNIAILFGREQSGLTNEEMDLCQRAIRIPANPEYSSLNIASAVQIICYEIMANMTVGRQHDDELKTPLATHDEMEKLYAHLQQTMTDINFYDPEKPRRLMRRLKRLFNRAQLDNNEYNILRGFLARVQEKTRP